MFIPLTQCLSDSLNESPVSVIYFHRSNNIRSRVGFSGGPGVRSSGV